MQSRAEPFLSRGACLVFAALAVPRSGAARAGQLHRALQQLSSTEQRVYLRLYDGGQAIRSHTYALSRALRRRLLAQWLQLPPARVDFVDRVGQAPKLRGQLARKANFGLTHANEVVGCVVTDEASVGIDVEQLNRFDEAPWQAQSRARLERLVRRICSPEERDAVLVLPVARRAAAFLQLWTCKEAALKACGTGLRLRLSATAIEAPAQLLRQREMELAQAPWRCMMLPGQVQRAAIKSSRTQVGAVEVALALGWVPEQGRASSPETPKPAFLAPIPDAEDASHAPYLRDLH